MMWTFARVCLVAVVTLTPISSLRAKEQITSQLNEKQISEQGWKAYNERNFGYGIELMFQLPNQDDPKVNFTIGLLLLLWNIDPDPKEPPKYTYGDAIAWIKRAARLGDPAAMGTLKSGYEHGHYSLPKNAVLAECWRAAQSEEKKPTDCE